MPAYEKKTKVFDAPGRVHPGPVENTQKYTENTKKHRKQQQQINREKK